MTERIERQQPPAAACRRAADRLVGYLFVAFFTVPFLLFNIGPIFFGVYVAFTEWGIVGAPHWVGLDNFPEAFERRLGRHRLPQHAALRA